MHQAARQCAHYGEINKENHKCIDHFPMQYDRAWSIDYPKVTEGQCFFSVFDQEYKKAHRNFHFVVFNKINKKRMNKVRKSIINEKAQIIIDLKAKVPDFLHSFRKTFLFSINSEENCVFAILKW